MFKYVMDPMSIFEDTERTRFCPKIDGQTGGRWNQYIPFNFVERGYNQQNTV